MAYPVVLYLAVYLFSSQGLYYQRLLTNVPRLSFWVTPGEEPEVEVALT